jgi:DNA-binding transcriptional LysR family regulator
VAQPSLTRAIQVLERELGGPLFQRLPHGAELTALGARLKPRFATVAHCVDDIYRLARHDAAADDGWKGDIVQGFDPPRRAPPRKRLQVASGLR